MNPVIPVIDLMISQVVLAARGDRETYRPVHTKLTHSSQPIEVAKAIFNQTGCDVLYLADIDSFNGAHPNWKVYNELVNAGFGLWLDANWVSWRSIQKDHRKYCETGTIENHTLVRNARQFH